MSDGDCFSAEVSAAASEPISCQVSILNSYMHYQELGSGQPILFLHGMPTSSHIWRHVMPAMAAHGRCIAVDLIGMGKSGKPDIAYTTAQHIEYFEAFIARLGLQNITLVMHGWGSVIGFDYASRNENNIAGLAFYESHPRPVLDWNMLSLPVQQMASQLRDPQVSRNAVLKQNFFIEKLLPSVKIGPFAEEDMSVYREPFKELHSRRPLLQYLMELPLGRDFISAMTSLDAVDWLQARQQTLTRITEYSAWLQNTMLPKLMLYAVPGFNTTIDTVEWCRNNCPNVTVAAIDNALHLAQVSQPKLFAKLLTDWLQQEVLLSEALV